MIVMTIAAFGLGYIFISYLLDAKYEMQQNLTHLAKEIIHELNIPLSTIDANAKLISRNVSNDKDIQRLERINHATSRLKKLYDKLVYAITKEIEPVAKEKFELQSLIKECSEIFVMQNRNEIIFDMLTTPILLYGDKIGFEQVFDNLLGNAMKYSPNMTPVTIKLKENKLELIDRGIGMNDTELLHIHERYYQGDSNKDGKGIGLAVVKGYCDKEGISIQFHSTPDSGIRVILDISKVVSASH